MIANGHMTHIDLVNPAMTRALEEQPFEYVTGYANRVFDRPSWVSKKLHQKTSMLFVIPNGHLTPYNRANTAMQQALAKINFDYITYETKCSFDQSSCANRSDKHRSTKIPGRNDN